MLLFRLLNRARSLTRRLRKPAAHAGAAVLLLGLGACAPLKAIDTITSRDGYTLLAGLPYQGENSPAAQQQRHRADVYLPAPRSDTAPGTAPVAAPVLVFFYGGNWSTGDRADYRFVAAALAARGIIVVVPDYRLYPNVHYEGALDDSAHAVAWALRQAGSWGGDARRVYVGGHSAGAYNAAMVALDGRWLAKAGASPRQLAGLVGLAGPYNFLPIENPGTKLVFRWPDTPTDSQPVNHVNVQTAPRRSLLVAAEHDAVVDPTQNTEALAQALRKVGADVEVHRHAHLGHATTIGVFAWPLRRLAPVLQEVSTFLLLDAPAAPRAQAAVTQQGLDQNVAR